MHDDQKEELVFIEITVKARVMGKLSSIDSLKERAADIYLHAEGEDGHMNKADIGGWITDVSPITTD